MDQFLDVLSLERGLSENTRAAYQSDLQSLVAFMARRGIGDFNGLTRKDLLKFLMDERARGLGVNSVSRRLVAIKVFLRYLHQEGLAARNIAEAMDSPKLWRVLPALLSQREVEQLLQGPKGEKPAALRDRAILELLYATGLRVSELAKLDVDDVHMEERYVRCMGKGAKVRVVPFGEKAAAALDAYLRRGRGAFAKDADARRAFLTRLGRGFDRKGIWRLVKRHARDSGIGKPIHPHTLRHSFASHLLANGAPLRVIQEMLGHADIATSQIYTQVDQRRLLSVHGRYHPRA